MNFLKGHFLLFLGHLNPSPSYQQTIKLLFPKIYNKAFYCHNRLLGCSTFLIFITFYNNSFVRYRDGLIVFERL